MTEPVRPFVFALIERLVEDHRVVPGRADRGTGRVCLDDIEEAIGNRLITYEEVELIIDRLEQAGLRVGDELTPSDIGRIRVVLAAARNLRSSSARPTIASIATETGLDERLVRRALMNAKRLADLKRPSTSPH